MIENIETDPQLEKPRLFVQWHKGLGEYWISAIGFVDDFNVQNKIADMLNKSELVASYTVESRGSRVEVMPREKGMRKDEDVLRELREALGKEYIFPSAVEG